MLTLVTVVTGVRMVTPGTVRVTTGIVVTVVKKYPCSLLTDNNPVA